MLPVRSSISEPRLPNDVLVIIVSVLDKATLKQVRLCSRWLAKEATRHLFKRVNFHMNLEYLLRVIDIATNSATADAVQVLVLKQYTPLPKLTFEEWKRNAHMAIFSDENEERLVPVENGGEYQANPALPPLTLELFHRYEIDQKEPSIWVALHTRGPSLAETVLEDHSKPLVNRSEILQRLLKACTVFEQALLRLRNLHHLEVDLHPYPFHSWGGYFFSNNKRWMVPNKEAASLAFLLRILGRRNCYSNSLTSLRMILNWRMQWSLGDLQFAWISPEGSNYEDDQENEENEENNDEDDGVDHDGDHDEDHDEDDDEVYKQSNARLRRNVSIVEEAFTHLTDIHVAFGPTRNAPSLFGNTPGLFEALANFLAKSKKLVRLELIVYKSHIRPEDPPYDMLLEISDRVGWPRLSHLKLGVFELSETSILRILSRVDRTLKSLSMLQCRLIDETASWPKVYKEMRHIPFQALDDVDFKWCHQSAVQEELLSSARIGPNDLDAQQVSFVMEDDSGRYMIQYPPVIYDFTLKRTDTMPPARCVRAEDYEALNNNLL